MKSRVALEMNYVELLDGDYFKAYVKLLAWGLLGDLGLELWYVIVCVFA